MSLPFKVASVGKPKITASIRAWNMLSFYQDPVNNTTFYSLVRRRFRLGHSWTLPWAVTSPRDTRRERVLLPAIQSQTSRGQWIKGERLGTRLYFLYIFFSSLNSNLMGAFYLPKTLRNFHGPVHRVKNVFHLTSVYALVTKIQDGGTDIPVNSLELVIPCENS